MLLSDVIELRAWNAGEVVATCLLSLRHRGEGNRDPALECPCPSCPCLLQLRQASRCFEKQAME